jgi:protein-S-isoprenylcysteine O-methyltransferase Ste14
MNEQGTGAWFETTVPPPVVGLASLFLQHRLAPRKGGSARRAAAAALAAGGSVALMGTAAAAFRRHRTTVHPLHPEQASHLVDEGPFGLTRNPMYVGMAGLLAAHAVLRGGLTTWLPVAGFVAFIDRAQIQPEERALRTLFGEEYDAYVRSVPRWLL